MYTYYMDTKIQDNRYRGVDGGHNLGTKGMVMDIIRGLEQIDKTVGLRSQPQHPGHIGTSRQLSTKQKKMDNLEAVSGMFVLIINRVVPKKMCKQQELLWTETKQV